MNNGPFAILSDNPNRHGVMTWMLTGYTYEGPTIHDGIFLHADLPDGLSTPDAQQWATAMLRHRGYRVVEWDTQWHAGLTRTDSLP